VWIFEASLFGPTDEVSDWIGAQAKRLARLSDVGFAELFLPVPDLGPARMHHAENAPQGILLLGFQTEDALRRAASGADMAQAFATLPETVRAIGAGFRREREPLADDDLRNGGTLSNVVRYRMPCDDVDGFVRAYMAPHLKQQTEFAGIRRILGFDPLRDPLDLPSPLEPAGYLVGNEITFDDLNTLHAAMTSPVRSKLRALFDRLPPFGGGNTHHIMTRAAIG